MSGTETLPPPQHQGHQPGIQRATMPAPEGEAEGCKSGQQYPQKDIGDITPEQIEYTFRTDIFSMFYLTQAAVPHLGKGSTIVNTASVMTYRGSSHLLDYSSTKGAIVAFTRSLAQRRRAGGKLSAGAQLSLFRIGWTA